MRPLARITRTGDKPFGSTLDQYARDLRQALIAVTPNDPESAVTMNVPCGDCVACCRGYRITFVPGLDAHRADLFVDGVLPRRADGYCQYLIDGQCSVYERRPAGCRLYDCRSMAVCGLGPGDLPGIVEAIAQWNVPDGGIRDKISSTMPDVHPNVEALCIDLVYALGA
jgi:hypothetical protein